MADKLYKGKYTGEQIDAGIAAANAAAPQATTYTKEEINENYVKKTDYASETTAGCIKVAEYYGLFIVNGVARVNAATKQNIAAETNVYNPLVPNSIPTFMSNYGITSKTLISEMQEQIDSLTSRLDAAGITAAIPDTMMDQESFEMVGAVPETKE